MTAANYVKLESLNVETLLGEKGSELIIPDYQRTYDWKKDLTNYFLTDLWDAFKKNKPVYFIGIIILSKKETAHKSRDVVDGQQRIITISLLIAHLASKMKDFSKDESLDEKMRKVLNDWSVRLGDLIIKEHEYKGDEKTRVRLYNLGDQRVYEKLLDNEDLSGSGNDDTAKRLQDSHTEIGKFLNEKVSNNKYKDLKDFAIFLLRKVILTKLSFDEEKLDAYEIFEVLNDRRQELTQVDLIKNYFFRMVKASHKNSNSTDIQENWKILTNDFKENLSDMEGCIGSYFMWRFGDINTKHLYREVKKRTEKNNYHTPKKEIEEEIKEYTYQLKNDASRFYRRIKENSEDLNQRPDKKKDQEFRQYIDFLRNFDVLYPSLLAPLLKEKYQPSKSWHWETVTKYYKLLYYFILRIYSSRRSFPANKLQPFFARLAYNININKDGLESFDKVQKCLIEQSKKSYNDSFDRDSFIKNFSLLNVNDSKKAKQILVAINYLYSKPDTRIDLNNVDLEHILPKNWNKNLEDWKKFLLVEDGNIYLQRLGNYTLWYNKENRKAKDAPYKAKDASYKEKKVQYRESQVKITRDIPDNHKKDWSPDEITKRQKDWAETAEESWQLDKV